MTVLPQVRKLFRPLWVILALAFLFEAWLWDQLQPIVAEVVDLVPWRRLKARLAALIRTLSPTATLAVFIVPVVVLFPVKLLEVWLLAHRRWLAAIVLLAVAKLIGVGVTAFIFDVTRTKSSIRSNSASGNGCACSRPGERTARCVYCYACVGACRRMSRREGA